MKKFNNENAAVTSILILLLMPVFIWAVFTTLDHSFAVNNSDINLQQAVSEGVRAGTMCINKTSQAHNEPLIEADTAHMVFSQILARNFELDLLTLAPKEGSGLKSAPEYTFIVYNGSDKYGVSPAVKYTSSDQEGILLENNGFPQSFAIYPEDIISGTGDLSTNFEAPGCVAVVRVTAPNIGPGESEIARWAAAKIHKRGGYDI